MNKNKSAAMAQFESLLNEQFSSFRKGFNPGEHVKAVVVSVNSSYVVLDVKSKNEGLVPRAEFLDENNVPTVKPGDEVDVVFVSSSGGALLFAARDSSGGQDRSLIEAFEASLPVYGKVQGEVNGGYEVSVGSMRAFCPYSQMDLFRQEGAEYVGRGFDFLIQECDEEGRNLVVSRRAFLERERNREKEALKSSLAAGALVEGRVTRLVNFGFFVELGGAEGLVPLKELSWQRNAKPEDVVSVGDTVQVLVREIDWERNRISLSLRGTVQDPFDGFAQKTELGAEFCGTVTSLHPFGAFVELVPGVEGLVPTGALGRGRPIARPSQVVSVGDKIDVKVESIDGARHRIGLVLVPTAEEKAAAEAARLERAKKQSRRKEPEEEEFFDVRKALEDFRKSNSDNGSFGSLGDAFSKIKL